MTNTSGAAAPQEPNRLSALSVPQIHRLMAVEADTIAKAKSRLDALQGEVSARFKEEVTAAYDRAGKVSGVVRIPLPDGYELTADAKKAIKWDSAKLLQVARFMEWEQVQRLFKLEVSMGEKIYDGVAAADPALREKIDVARTVEIKPVVVKLSKKEG